MGSTLETAIVFSTIMLIICLFIVAPLNICGEAYNDFCDSEDEIVTHDTGEISAERFNTMLVGLSENYRMIYDSFSEGNDEA